MIKDKTHRAKCTQMKWAENKKGFKIAELKLEIVDGDDIGGKIFTELQINDKSIAYTKRDLMLLGWDGVDPKHAPVQIVNATAAGLTVDIEVEHVDWNGKKFPAVRRIGEPTTKSRPLSAIEVDSLGDAFKSAGSNEDSIPF